MTAPVFAVLHRPAPSRSIPPVSPLPARPLPLHGPAGVAYDPLFWKRRPEAAVIAAAAIAVDGSPFARADVG